MDLGLPHAVYGMHPVEEGQDMGHSKLCTHAVHLFRVGVILNTYNDTMQDTGSLLHFYSQQ